MNDGVEYLPRAELEALQLERLQRTVDRLLGHDGPMRARLVAAGIGSGSEVGSLTALRGLPFSVKADLRDHYPFGLVTVPMEQIVRIHGSSGTGGKPTLVAYTAADLDVWTTVMARSLAMTGVRAGMVVHNAYGYGLFTGGIGFHQGAERLAATVIPVAGGQTARQVTLLRDVRGQALCATPSYALHIAEALDDAGIGPADLALEVGLFGAEPWTEAMRSQLEVRLGLRAFNFYGLSEIVGPGVSAECPEARDGLHVNEDHFLPEVVDPDTGDPVADGEVGELVFTTLTKEALPLLRYRTGDIASLTRAPCACGRTLTRMSPVHGRHDDMLVVRGVNLYPSEVERVLLGVDGIAPHYQLVLRRDGALDELTVQCEPAADGADPERLRERADHALREATGVGMRVEVRPRGSVARSEGKAVRVLDQR